MSGSGARKPIPSGPTSARPLARLEGGEALGAGADVLEQELEPHAALSGPGARVREGTRQVRPLVGSPTPPLRRREHVELARAGGRPDRRGPRPRSACRRRAPRCRRRSPHAAPAARACAAPRSPPPASCRAALAAGSSIPWCSSWSAITDTSPLRLARMARWAALAPLRVVMQGMPEPRRSGGSRSRRRGAPEPVGVLITMSTSPASIRSTTLGDPSDSFRIRSTGTPMRRIAWAVPPVASTLEAHVVEARGELRGGGLVAVRDRDEHRAGRRSSAPAAAWALPNAAG